MQGGLSQCMQGRGSNFIFTSGYSPSTSVMSCIHEMDRPISAWLSWDGGMLFSAWQATTHAWQAVQRSRSITMPHLAISSSLPGHAFHTDTRVAFQNTPDVSGSVCTSTSGAGF